MDQIKTGRFIAELRKSKGMTQEKMAEQLGVSGKTVSRWENGRNLPDASLFEPVCELLDITPGSVSVLGLMNDHNGRVRLLIDRDLLKDAYLCCHPCINTSTLKLRMADAVDVMIPELAHTPTYVDLPVYEPQA